jgi:hypothetical protein
MVDDIADLIVNGISCEPRERHFHNFVSNSPTIEYDCHPGNWSVHPIQNRWVL